MKKLLLFGFLMLLSIPLFSQQDVNLDFHNGFNGWRAQSGSYQSSTVTTPVYTWTSGIIANPGTFMDGTNAFVINSNTTQRDEVVAALPKIPPGYTKSATIANKSASGECKQLRYTIDAIEADKCMLVFNYAVVLMAPHNGSVFINPTFQIKVLKDDGTLLDACTFVQRTGDPTSGPGGTMPAGWLISPTQYDGEPVMYLPWQKVALSLQEYIGQSVTIEINISDCAYTMHFGYCYFVGGVAPAEITTRSCALSDTVSVLSAPEGFNAYGWYNDPSFGVGDPATICTGTPLSTNREYALLRNNFPDNEPTRSYICKITANTNLSNPCQGYLRVSVTNTKSYPEYSDSVDCQQRVHLRNKTFSPVSQISSMKWYFKKAPGQPVINFAPDSITCTAADLAAKSGSTYNPIYQLPSLTQDARYVVQLVVYSAGSDCWQVYSDTVLVHASPDLTVPDTVRGCSNIAMDIRAESTVADTIKWYLGTDTEPCFVGRTLSRAFAKDTFLVVKSISNAIDCPKMDTIIVKIDAFPRIVIQGDSIVCMGNESVLSVVDSLGNARGFEWTFTRPSNPPTMTNPQANPVFRFYPTVDTTVYLLAVTPNGCVDYTSVRIRMTDPVVKSDTRRVCPNINGNNIYPAKLWGEQAVTYSWESNPADPSLPVGKTNDTICVYPSETTVYTMKGYGSNDCFSERTLTIEVVPFPIARIEASPEYVDVDNPDLSLSDVSPHGVSSFFRLSDGTTNTARSFVHTFASTEGDSVQVFLTSANALGCVDSTRISLPINLFSVFFPNSFSPVENYDPSLKSFKIHTTNPLSDFELYIYNRFGQCIFSYTTPLYNPQQPEVNSAWDGKFNGNFVENGVYVYKCRYKRYGEKRVRQTEGSINFFR